MITGKYGNPIPPPGCIWEREPIILYSELAEAYDKGWAVFESFTSDSLGREVTSQFTLERVWNAMGSGRRFVCEQPVNVMSPPEGLKSFPNKQMVYIGKGPLPEDKWVFSEDEDPLWHSGRLLVDWDQFWYSGSSDTAHYAVDPTTQYAREHWPEHVAAWERAMEEERRLISQEALYKKWQKRVGGDAIMYPSDSIITLTSTTYKDPTRVPEGVEPLPEGYTWAYFGPGPLPEDAQFTGDNHCDDELLACMPDAVSKELQDNMVHELTSFVPKVPWEQNACGEVHLKGTDVGSWYNWIIPGRCMGKSMFVHKEYIRQMERLMRTTHIPPYFMPKACKPDPNKVVAKGPKGLYIGCDQGAPEVTAETIKLPARPKGMPDHLIYLGEGPLPHERQRLTPWEWKYCHGLYGLKIGREPVSKFGHCNVECNGAFKDWHYALDPHSTYAYKHWPELYLGAKPEKESLTAQMVAEASCLELSPGSNLAFRIADNLNKRLE